MLVAADRAGTAVRELDFLIDTPTAAALAALKLDGPPVRWVVARVHGVVKASPTTAYRVVVVVDEVALLDTSGNTAVKLSFGDDDSAKLLADMAAAPAGWVGSPCEARVAVSSITEELVQSESGPRTVRRLVFTTTTGKPVSGVKIYLSDALAAAAAAAYKQHGGGLQNAEVSFRPLRVDRATGELVCAASHLKLFAPGWMTVRWEDSGEVKDPNPDPVLTPPSVPVAAGAAKQSESAPGAPTVPPPAADAVPQLGPPAALQASEQKASASERALVFAVGLGVGVVILAIGGGLVWLLVRSRSRTTERGTKRRTRDDEDEGGDDEEEDRPRPRKRRRDSEED
jgi:hypothetical protein